MDATRKSEIAKQYLAAVSDGDVATIRAMYATDAILEDPVGSDLREGIEAICEFYEQGAQMNVSAELTGAPRCAGNTVAFPFKVKVGEMTIEVIDVFEFNTDGKIQSMKAYWGPDNTK